MIAYFDAPSGATAEMLLACLLDCGWPPERMRLAAESLKLPARWAMTSAEVIRGGFRARVAECVVEPTPSLSVANARALLAGAGAEADVSRPVSLALQVPEASGGAEQDSAERLILFFTCCQGLAELGVRGFYTRTTESRDPFAGLLRVVGVEQQPEMTLCRVGVGADAAGPPQFARLWLGEPVGGA